MVGHFGSPEAIEDSQMKKFLLLVAATAFGLVIGSRFGKRPYDQIKAKVKKVSRRADVQEVVGTLKDAASDTAVIVIESAQDKMTGMKETAATRAETIAHDIRDQ